MSEILRRLPGGRYFRRALNLVRKIASGLTPFGENVSPEVPNDLFVAHLSIYAFASQYAAGARVLDLGCGAGYGSEYLRQAGASVMVGVDVDPRNIRYASRHYPLARFRAADAGDLPSTLGSFDLIVASNVLEHLDRVEPALDTMRGMLAPHRGRLVIAVPPIVDDESLKANEAIPYHRSNHMVSRWIELLSARFTEVQAYRHFWRTGIQPDFTDPFRSRLAPGDFFFEEVSAPELLTTPTLTAMFVVRV